MDPLTHAISGAVLARALPKRPLALKQLALIAALAMLPDIDIVLRLLSDPLYLQHHRGLTHSLLMLPLWGWLLFNLCPQRIRTQPRMPLLIAGALLLHIALDLITSYGTMIFAPLSDLRIRFDLLFIIDPLFTATLLLPLLAGLFWRRQARRLAALGFALAAAYLLLAANNHQQAVALARQAQSDAAAHYALPMAFSPFNWQLIAEYPDYYARAVVDLKPSFPGLRPLFADAFVTRTLSSRVGRPQAIQWQQLTAMHAIHGAMQLPGAAFYRWFARFPALLIQNQSQLEFGDLAFGAGAPGVHAPFRFHIERRSSNEPPHAWLIWRDDRCSELRGLNRPFDGLPGKR